MNILIVDDRSTVRSYRKRLLDELNMKANADIVRYAVDHRLIL
jgi:DNA-binding CsgD family transcriptional regulator